LGPHGVEEILDGISYRLARFLLDDFRRSSAYRPGVQPDFKDRVEAASRAGFTGFGIWHADLERVQQEYSLKDMKQILNDNGIRHVELEFLTDWFLDGERKKQSDARKRKLLEAADVLGARHIKVGDFFQEECSMARLVDAFADLCKDAEGCGAKVSGLNSCLLP
jgi:sugar phosphate isomerase/epimerase